MLISSCCQMWQVRGHLPVPGQQRVRERGSKDHAGGEAAADEAAARHSVRPAEPDYSRQHAGAAGVLGDERVRGAVGGGGGRPGQAAAAESALGR